MLRTSAPLIGALGSRKKSSSHFLVAKYSELVEAAKLRPGNTAHCSESKTLLEPAEASLGHSRSASMSFASVPCWLGHVSEWAIPRWNFSRPHSKAGADAETSVSQLRELSTSTRPRLKPQQLRPAPVAGFMANATPPEFSVRIAFRLPLTRSAPEASKSHDLSASE